MADLGPPIKLNLKGRLVPGPSATLEDDVITFRSGSVAVIKILEPINPMLNYYEYKILDRGDESAIGIGAGSLSYPQGRMPGWNRDSIGYHADDGKLYHERGYGTNFGPTCTTGDRMGCGIDFESEAGGNYVRIFFTKNGVQVGSPQRMKRPVHGLYPLFGLHSRNERIKYLGHWHVSPQTLQEMMRTEHSPSTYWIRSNGIRFSDNSLTLEYAGEGGRIQDCALAQANFPMSITNHYFELEILDGGAGCSIAIGLAKLSYPLHRHPGWNAGAVGYHADDGKLFQETGIGKEYGPTCASGDIMGCGIRFTDDTTEEFDDLSSESDTSLPEESFGRGGNVFGRHGLIYDSGSDEDYDEDLFGGPGHFGGLGRFGEPGLFARIGDNPFGGGLGIPQRPVEKKTKDKSKHEQVKVYFTKNGERLEEVECDLPSGGFYPVVAMLSRGEKIKVNLYPLSG